MRQSVAPARTPFGRIAGLTFGPCLTPWKVVATVCRVERRLQMGVGLGLHACHFCLRYPPSVCPLGNGPGDTFIPLPTVPLLILGMGVRARDLFGSGPGWAGLLLFTTNQEVAMSDVRAFAIMGAAKYGLIVYFSETTAFPSFSPFDGWEWVAMPNGEVLDAVPVTVGTIDRIHSGLLLEAFA